MGQPVKVYLFFMKPFDKLQTTGWQNDFFLLLTTKRYKQFGSSCRYSWNRSDPEASFKYNADLLRSGKTGLSPQKIKGHLARLAHMRDKQLARRRRMRDQAHRHDRPMNDRPNETPKEQPLVKVHARTYTIDNNISALHPKMIVEELDMLPPPPSVVPRNTRGARRFPGYG